MKKTKLRIKGKIIGRNKIEEKGGLAHIFAFMSMQ